MQNNSMHPLVGEMVHHAQIVLLHVHFALVKQNVFPANQDFIISMLRVFNQAVQLEHMISVLVCVECALKVVQRVIQLELV